MKKINTIKICMNKNHKKNNERILYKLQRQKEKNKIKKKQKKMIQNKI